MMTTQPQGVARIDWSNPITKGLFVCPLVTNAGIVDATSGYLPQVPYATSKSVCSGGRSLLFSGQSVYIDQKGIPYYTLSGDVTFFTIASTTNVNAGAFGQYILSTGTGGGTGDQGGIAFRNGKMRVVTGAGFLDGTTPLANNRLYRFAFTRRLSDINTIKMFIDGVLEATTTIDAVNGGYDSRLAIGSYGAYDPTVIGLYGLFVFGAVWTRALTEYEIKSLSDNPWQIFAETAPNNRSFPIFTGVNATVTLPIIGRPISDTITGSWVPSTGGDLWACIDETTEDDSDYIEVNSSSMCEIELNTTAFPGGTTQVISYKASSLYGSTLTVRLKQGILTIAEWSHALTSTDTLYQQTLTEIQIAAITSGNITVQMETS